MDKKAKHIIFDLGGVLFHWNPKEILKILKAEDPHFPEDIPEIILTKAWTDFDTGLIKLQETVEILSDSYHRTHLERFIELSLEKLAPIPHGLQLLESVQSKGCKTFILSNISEEFLNNIYPQHLFLDSFDGAVFSYQIKVVKPQEKIYHALLNKYHLKPEECLFIDDSPANVKAALNIGIDAILCQDHHLVEEELKKRGIIL
jgi:HAD superfamily hydrolase (TIGR01509 family)